MKNLLSILLLFYSFQLVAQNASITGVVTDDEGPLVGAIVLVKENGKGSNTDLDGKFAINELEPGTYTLQISYIGFEAKEQEVILEAGQRKELGEINLSAASSTLSEVTVTGRLDEGGEEASRLKMLRSERISNIVGQRGIERLPDKNAGEALARMAGVVLETDQGEGKYVSFRGTPVDWSSTLVNGDRMPIANEEMVGRSLNFDVLPTSLVAYIENSISLSPEFEGDAIGGTANLVTKNTPPDSMMLEAQIGFGHNEKANKPIWNGALTYGNRFLNKKLGVLVGGSVYQRNWATNNYEIFYGANDNHSIERLELRDYRGLKSSYGANAKLDFRIANGHLLYASGFLGITEDDEFNRKAQFNWVAGVGQSVRTQNIHNILRNQLTGAEFGGEHQLGKLGINWKIAQYENEFGYGSASFGSNDPRNGYFVVEFEQVVRYNDYLYLDEEGNPTDPNNAFTRLRLLDIDSPVEGYGDPYDRLIPSYDNIVAVKPSDTLLVFNKAYSELNEHTEKDPIVARLDFNLVQNPKAKYKAGLKFRSKTGKRKLGLDGWVRNPLDPEVIVQDDFSPKFFNNGTDFLSEIGSPYAGLVPAFLEDKSIDNIVNDLGERLVYLPFGDQTPFFREFIGSSFEYNEDVVSGYIMGDWKLSDKLSLNGGLRWEETFVSIAADSVVENVADNSRSILKTELDKDYRAILPMLNFRYDANRSSVFRLSLTRSFRRPNFNELKPGDPEIHYTHFHVLYGNPNLRPTFSWNADLSYQHFFGLKGMAMLSVYYKRVIDHIFTSFESQNLDIASEANQFIVPGGLLGKRYQNAPYSNLAGVELTISRKLDFISPSLKNFELMFNYTHTYSRMKIDERDALQALPRQAPNLVNLRLSYDAPRLQINLGANYRDPYLQELNLFALKDPVTGEPTIIQQDGQFDVFVGKNISMDGSATFRINSKLSLMLEVNNLLNTPYIVYRGRRERPVQTEFYGPRGQATLRYNFRGGKIHQPLHNSNNHAGHNH